MHMFFGEACMLEIALINNTLLFFLISDLALRIETWFYLFGSMDQRNQDASEGLVLLLCSKVRHYGSCWIHIWLKLNIYYKIQNNVFCSILKLQTLRFLADISTVQLNSNHGESILVISDTIVSCSKHVFFFLLTFCYVIGWQLL